MSELVSEIRDKGKAVLVMMGVAIIAVLAMIVLDYFGGAIRGMSNLGAYNLSDSVTTINETAQAALTLFITAFGITGSFAAITVLIIVVKVIIGVVRGLKT